MSIVNVEAEEVPFKVVRIWKNDWDVPFSLKKMSERSEPVFAVYVEGNYFLIGGKNEAIHISD
jgi:hypothetical protein